jgi:hypothetical protein
LGNKPIKEIKSAHVLATLKPLIEKSQLEAAHRLHSEISSIFAYVIVHNFIDYDPAQKAKHRAAIIDPKQVAQLLRDISNDQGTFVVQSAFRLSPLLFQRPGESGKCSGPMLIWWRGNGGLTYPKPIFTISYRYRLKPLRYWKRSNPLRINRVTFFCNS